jgi:hypothetical protein
MSVENSGGRSVGIVRLRTKATEFFMSVQRSAGRRKTVKKKDWRIIFRVIPDGKTKPEGTSRSEPLQSRT